MMTRPSVLCVAMANASAKLLNCRRGAAAVEFVIIAPLLLLMFFGTVEVSSGISADRKVSLVARALSDLTSQSVSVTDADVTNIFAAASAIMTPYSATAVKAKISEIKIDASGNATIGWSKASNDTAYTKGAAVASVPAALKVANTYLIWSEVNYSYTPLVGHDMANTFAAPTFNLSDSFYSRPRQSVCVLYSTTSCP